ncbi:S-fimbrial adhesin protein SfaS precursor [compost metagenome]
MNKHIKRAVMALVIMAAGYNVARADPVSIAIAGRVVASPCVIDGNGSELAVNLGNSIQSATLATAGAGSTPTTFNLSLTGCPAGTKNVKVTFTGTAAAAPQANMYLNTGTATPLAIELSQQGTGTILGNGSSLTQAVQADKTVTYALSARAVTATGNVLPGIVMAVILADFTYN